MNIPNLFTLLRLVLVPVIVILLIQGAYAKAFAAFFVAALTDAFDGFLARMLNKQSAIGAYLDPIADKALLISSFVTLAVVKAIPSWLAVIVISRDLIILLGISILFIMSVSVEIRPLFVSKVTTAFQLATILAALAGRAFPALLPESILAVLCWVTALLTIISGIKYLLRGLEVINHKER